MIALAGRSRSSIGAQYAYHPDTKAIASALLDLAAEQIEEHGRPPLEEIDTLSAEAFSERAIGNLLLYIAKHPAFRQLSAAAVRPRRIATAKRAPHSGHPELSPPLTAADSAQASCYGVLTA